MKLVRSMLSITVLSVLLAPGSASAQDPIIGTPNCNAVSNGNNSSGDPVGAPRGPQGSEEIGDATVVAIVDYEPFTPYHRDMYAKYMPQHQDVDPSNDLPLHCSPETWLPGFTTESVDSFERLDLTLGDSAGCNTLPAANDPANCPSRASLSKADETEWRGVSESGVEDRGTTSETDHGINSYWIPGSKVISALTFGDQGLNYPEPTSHTLPVTSNEGHGVGSTSVSVGSIHGTCPECLLVFIQVDVSGIEPYNGLTDHDTDRMEQALEWAYDQPWIDVVSMPGTPSATPLTRDRVYQASRTEFQASASERGQTIFFSSGNGHDAVQAAVPTTTPQSSLQGPDWVMTVSGTDFTQQRGRTNTGFGKIVDVSGVASDYPSAYGSKTVGGQGVFAATSNAVGMTSGLFAKSLYEARRAMTGPSRTSGDGVVAMGRFDCGSQREDCELADGVLTAVELRRRFLLGAQHTDTGAVGRWGVEPLTVSPSRLSWEEDFAAEGHGTYLGRCLLPARGPVGTTTAQANGYNCKLRPVMDPDTDLPGDNDDLGDVLEPLLRPLFGYAPAPELLTYEQGGRPPGEKDWFTVDSYCRQLLWGAWTGGYYNKATPLAGPDPAWPLRQGYREACPLIPTPYHAVGDRDVHEG